MTSKEEANRLFQPIKVGNMDLKHRVVMAPLTRSRASSKGHVPPDIARTYYGQRASTPGTLIITEATFIAPQAAGYDSVPGIWSVEQIESWKKITAEVHKHGSFIFLQLWALGRTAEPNTLKEDGFKLVSSSPTPLSDTPAPLPYELTIPEIQEYIDLYAQAAENAVFKAGFDGVEIHGANGYLVDQFLQDVVNKRTDEYGGSIENRSRFGLEVVQAVVQRVGAERTGIRLSPWSTFQEMRMEDPVLQFRHFIEQLAVHRPNLAYLHCVEARVAGSSDADASPSDTLDFARDAWRITNRPFLIAGGFDRASAMKLMEKEDAKNCLVVFGRLFISNPDLPIRLKQHSRLTSYIRAKFQGGADEGYTDYPFLD